MSALAAMFLDMASPTLTGSATTGSDPVASATVESAIIAGSIALAALLLTVIFNIVTYRAAQTSFANTVKQQELALDREFKSKVFRDFLVQESERSDVYSVYAKLVKRRSLHIGLKSDPAEIERLRLLEIEIEDQRATIDRARARVWESISAIQMLSGAGVLVAARKYDKLVSANNPMRKAPVHMDYATKRDLIFNFQNAARDELGLPSATFDSMFWDEQAELVDRDVEVPY